MEQNINVTPTKNNNIVFIFHPTDATKMMKTNMNFVFNLTKYGNSESKTIFARVCDGFHS